jgi:four helix bundle protein
MVNASIKTFKDLLIWQRSSERSLGIYRLTNRFPRHEFCGLKSELRKTSRSVFCNIAEGHRRESTIEYIRFLRISAGSAAELESQILSANRLGYVQGNAADQIPEKIAEIERMLDSLIRSLKMKLSRAC